MSLLDLPGEILQDILLRISGADLIPIFLTCAKLRSIADSQHSWSQRCVVEFGDDLSRNEIFDWKTYYQSNLFRFTRATVGRNIKFLDMLTVEGLPFPTCSYSEAGWDAMTTPVITRGIHVFQTTLLKSQYLVCIGVCKADRDVNQASLGMPCPHSWTFHSDQEFRSGRTGTKTFGDTAYGPGHTVGVVVDMDARTLVFTVNMKRMPPLSVPEMVGPMRFFVRLAPGTAWSLVRHYALPAGRVAEQPQAAPSPAGFRARLNSLFASD
ncbi:hypothetical protein PAPYR_3961 [Paratrimastix pyriformis]|uniref:F-box domain-containing protein n=1 Tax=Paratrimastix pyriformis TaxID=342808 RepID=A0ABQ8UNN2_9EUKA|nr:hypothetical protein PAPYR_3961 [Paratrimastix pyriformis]